MGLGREEEHAETERAVQRKRGWTAGAAAGLLLRILRSERLGAGGKRSGRLDFRRLGLWLGSAARRLDRWAAAEQKHTRRAARRVAHWAGPWAGGWAAAGLAGPWAAAGLAAPGWT